MRKCPIQVLDEGTKTQKVPGRKKVSVVCLFLARRNAWAQILARRRPPGDSPDEAFKWVLEAYDKDANHDSLRDPGKFLALDTKLLAALAKVARAELSREILIFQETEASKSRAVRGRQVLYLFDQYFKTNEEVGSLYSVEDLLKVRLPNDDLSTFINNWESVMSHSR